MKKNKTIAGLNEEPNKSTNPIQNGTCEDSRLSKIRQFKGSIKDFKSYWDDRSN